jgi:hypothetical protein
MYETALFDCQELEAFILGKNGTQNASYSFTGLEIVADDNTQTDNITHNKGET